MDNGEYLFLPGKKDMRLDYPELSTVSEFKTLTSKEMRFVWLYSNDSSPLQSLSKNERLSKAFTQAFGDIASDELWEKYKSFDFSLAINKAIEKMKSYDLGIRMRAKMGIEKIFNRLEKIMSIDESQLEDLNKASTYVTLSIKIADSMPNIIKLYEQGFGIKTKIKRLEEDTGAKIADIIPALEEKTKEFL